MRKIPFFLIAIFALPLHAQSLEEARQLYLNKDFAAALPAFATAVKTSPKNASYNQWYGACLVETGCAAEAAPYLEFAASKNIPEAHNYLGKMYFAKYQFDKAKDAYEQYRRALLDDNNTARAAEAALLTERATRAARMLSRCEDVQIIDSIVVEKSGFIAAFRLGEDSGTLEETGNSAVYENELGDRRVFGKTAADGFTKLFSQSKIREQWADERQLALPSDSACDLNYPFLMPDGLTIYFASDGNGSIGGYDLFVSRFNLNNDSWLAPSQLGMPFNSIYNDYLLAIDEVNDVGYFASDRFQPEGRVVVYTFIPNEEITPIGEDGEDAHLAERAMITSISDTWKPDFNRTAFLENLKSSLDKNTKSKAKSFSFVIDDNTIYYALEDFKSDAAKDAFRRSEELKKTVESLEDQLDTQREEWRGASASRRESLKTAIKSNETRLESLFEDLHKALKETRNKEINFLKTSK
jgi:uncharacterized protein YukE